MVRIVAILASKRITVRSMLQFIFTRLQKINQLHKQESNYVSLYVDAWKYLLDTLRFSPIRRSHLASLQAQTSLIRRVIWMYSSLVVYRVEKRHSATQTTLFPH